MITVEVGITNEFVFLGAFEHLKGILLEKFLPPNRKSMKKKANICSAKLVGLFSMHFTITNWKCP